MKTITAALVGLLIAGAGSAGASTISHTDLPNGLSNVGLDIDGVHIDVSASVRTFKSKTVNGVTGVGIAQGSVDAEVDNLEAITFAFSKPVFVNTLMIAHLYTDGNFGDVVDESALMTTEAGPFLLKAVGDTTATWDGFGTVTNMSPGNNSGGGEWMADMTGDGIFGQAITSLTLSSGQIGNASKADFSFVRLDFSTRDVPAPGAAPGLLALAALGARRKRHSS